MRRSTSIGILLPLHVGVMLIAFLPALVLLTVLRAINGRWGSAVYRELALANDAFTRYRLRLAGEFVWDDPDRATDRALERQAASRPEDATAEPGGPDRRASPVLR